ncbi:hypothetical protein [Thiobacillus denitrificans]|uniref:Uncharacterized protein n=1 Tax=Thiobacillus denitrificans TaxID=36861 RepID=A0A106BLJ2_THIDE|nr:hypothetical protein [Thiobacillus denitrificans]KVW94689.1 hypothetical protein ABW22_11660 [Thiobacillus denitrificans]
MFKLPKALSAWNTDAFEQTLKIEIRNLGIDSLPLSHGLDMGGYVDNGHITIMVLRAVDVGVAIQCKVGIFFTEIVPCCGCPIEPMERDAYCVMQVRIDKSTADAEFVATPG